MPEILSAPSNSLHLSSLVGVHTPTSKPEKLGGILFSWSLAAVSQSLQFRWSSLYLFVVSLLGLATLSSFQSEHSGSPVLEIGSWWSYATGFSPTWAISIDAWLNSKTEFVILVCWVLLTISSISVAVQRQKSLHHRASASLVLALAIGASIHVSEWAMGMSAIFIGVACLIIRKVTHKLNADEVFSSIFAVIFSYLYAPIIICAWMVGDTTSLNEDLKERQVSALEKIANGYPDPRLASGAKIV